MSRHRPLRAVAAAAAVSLFAVAACSSDAPLGGPVDAAAAGADLVPAAPSPVEGVSLTTTLAAPGLSAPVDVVRDAYGVPHIYGATLPDVAYAQGYVTASDRYPQMDLARRNAEGSLAELFGVFNDRSIDVDIRMRVHHLRATAAAEWDQLQASTDPRDQVIAAVLTRFAAGVNAWLVELAAGKHPLPAEFGKFLYNPSVASARKWTEVDSLLLGQLLAFQLAFDADPEITNSIAQAAASLRFDHATDPALLARKGFGQDLESLAPTNPTYTIAGWTGMNGDTTTGALDPRSRPLRRRVGGGAGNGGTGSGGASDGTLLALLLADRPTLAGIGTPGSGARGSNNWAVAAAASATGHPLLASDPHLGLGNPSTLYMVHLVARGGAVPLDAHGIQLPGVPGIILGFNRHVAWGGTVNYIDLTDVYEEKVVACDGGSAPCVLWKGQKVPLVARKETIKIGTFTDSPSSVEVTFYDVPHHGPIVPRITSAHGLEPLAGTELSVRYTGYEPSPLARLVIDLPAAKDMKEAVAAVDRDATYARQNWMIADDQGHIGWTQATRVPRRSATAAPWRVLPGDGSAEWGKDLDPRYVPHAYDPQERRFLATANADPIGVSDDNDPFFDEPKVDGVPLYLGWDYDPGTRIGRITKRLTAATTDGKKASLDDMQSIQGDAVTEWGQLFQPTLVDAAQSLVEEMATPGAHPELTAIVQAASPTARALVPKALALVSAWSFDTPSAVAEDSPSDAALRDAQATVVYEFWRGRFYRFALGDELTALGSDYYGPFTTKLLGRMVAHPEQLATGTVPGPDGKPSALLFDDLTTKNVVETRRTIAARALVVGLDDLVARVGADPDGWRWGKLHTLALEFLTPVDVLRVPRASETAFPGGGFPRHGDKGTVDVGDHGLSDFTYAHGPNQRLVVDLDPAGPHARNVLPGGETFDPASPHYRDQMELWRKNRTFDVPFREDEVAASAKQELQAHQVGRTRFQP